MVPIIFPIKSGYVIEFDKQFMNQTFNYHIKMKPKHIDYVHALEEAKIPLMKLLHSKLSEGSVKVSMVFIANMRNTNDSTIEQKYFSNNEQKKKTKILTKVGANHAINKMFKSIEISIEQYKNHGSPFEYVSLVQLTINITKFDQSIGGSYVSAPKWIVNKKCCNNIKNKNQFCIDYCVAAYFLKPKDNAEKLKQYKQ